MHASLATLILSCAPLVHPTTLLGMIRVESAGNPFAVSVNRPQGLADAGIEVPDFEQPRTRAEALQLIERLAARGYSTSVGLVQINIEHLQVMQVGLAQLLDPCTNIALAQRILLACDSGQTREPNTSTQVRLRRTLSCYNSGHYRARSGSRYARDVARAAERQRRAVVAPARSGA
jgi:type IV secretion system protein VirB1